jgi:hypothetical protein
MDSPVDRTAAPVITKDEHLALLKLALEASLTARTKHDTREGQRRAKQPAQFKLTPWSYLAEMPAEKLRLEAMVRDPVRYALRKQVRDLGKGLYQVLGNTDAMLDMAEEVAAKDFQYRMTIIDKAWDGIGDWYA